MQINDSPDIAQTLGPQIRKGRLLRGMSQDNVADLIPTIYQADMSNYESGNKLPSAPTVQQIATLLSLPLWWFYTTNDDPPMETSGE